MIRSTRTFPARQVYGLEISTALTALAPRTYFYCRRSTTFFMNFHGRAGHRDRFATFGRFAIGLARPTQVPFGCRSAAMYHYTSISFRRAKKLSRNRGKLLSRSAFRGQNGV
jgi:hypothetical protein